MSSRPDRATVLRWIFLAVGLFLLFGGGSIIGFHTVVQQFAVVFLGEDGRQPIFIAFATFFPLVASAFCLITARGIRLGQSWSRPTGICAGLLLIGLFSWLSLAGFACLWALAKPLKMPVEAKPANPTAMSRDYWVAKRKSLAQRVVAGALALIGLAGFAWVKFYAWKLGMKSWDPGLLSLPVLLLIDVTVHEMGHVAMAWALHNRLRVINIGPFIFQDAGHGYHFHFDWRRLFGAGGFVSSASLTGENLRWKLVAEIAGGPAATVLASLIMAATFLSLPGTSLETCWWIPGYLSVVFLFDCIVNLIPLGFCDGSMLFHLILWTPEGRLLIGRSRLVNLREDADLLRGRAEFDKVAELWSKALEEALAGGERNAFAIAFCHERLGYADYNMHDWPAAEAQFRKCLEHRAECAFETAFLVNALSGLQRASLERHHGVEVGLAYAQALGALEKRRNNSDRVSRSVLGVMIARAHFNAHAFEKALTEAETVLRILPPGRDRILLRAEAYCIQARSQFALGAIALGRVSAAEASELLRSSDIPPGKRNLAWDDLADFAVGLRIADEAEMAVELLRDAIAGLEAGGATIAGALHRIALASILRQTGRHKESWQCLPDQAGLPDSHRRALLAERARWYLATGRPADAITECGWLLHLGKAEPMESAVVQSLLAEACLDAGDHQRATELAHQAADVLGPWQHCEMANCLVTTALAHWRSEGVWLPDYVEKARQLIESDSLLHAAGKRRRLEAQAVRLERHGVTAAAERLVTQG